MIYHTEKLLITDVTTCSSQLIPFMTKKKQHKSTKHQWRRVCVCVRSEVQSKKKMLSKTSPSPIKWLNTRCRLACGRFRFTSQIGTSSRSQVRPSARGHHTIPILWQRRFCTCQNHPGALVVLRRQAKKMKNKKYSV